MSTEAFYYILIRKGMTGGTPRSVFHMLCNSDGWLEQDADGSIDLYASDIKYATIYWTLTKAFSLDYLEHKMNIMKEAVGPGYDFFSIPLEEANRIEAGEVVVEDSPGMADPEIMKQIHEKISKSYILPTMTKEDFIKAKNQQRERREKDNSDASNQS